MIAAVMMVRDEEDILDYTLAHLWAQGVDVALVADNLSTDGTRGVLRAHRERVVVVTDKDPAYMQAEKMTRLVEHARMLWDPDWVIPCDADEQWLAVGGGTVAEALDGCQADVLVAEEWRFWPVGFRGGSPFVGIRWRESTPHRLGKVAFRPRDGARLHMGNHDVDLVGRRVAGVLKVHHFPYRTFGQFKRKVRNGREAYEAATSLHVGYGTHWREMGAMSDEQLRELWQDATYVEAVESGWLCHGRLVEDDR